MTNTKTDGIIHIEIEKEIFGKVGRYGFDYYDGYCRNLILHGICNTVENLLEKDLTNNLLYDIIDLESEVRTMREFEILLTTLGIINIVWWIVLFTIIL